MTRLRLFWLPLRARLLPWCMRPGCWEPSYLLHRPLRPPHRGNLCTTHFWESLLTVLMEGDQPKCDEPGCCAEPEVQS